VTGQDASWLVWAQRLRAIAQTGLAYSRDGYDLERFEEVGAIAQRMLAEIVDQPLARVQNMYLPERGYPTPKVDVRAGVFRGDEVLLVREAADGRWSLPGGWADEQDSPRENVEREVREESGYAVRAVKLAAVKDRHLHPYEPPRLERIYKLLFVCELPGGAAAAGLETTAARFFPLRQLPELSRGRTLPADIEALASHERDRSLPVAFD
jgi:ADP-ribose pyrophosphatase YjhB (NUDIX family)